MIVGERCKPVHTVQARRDGTWWALDVPELAGVHSQCKRLDQAKATIQGAIELLYDRAPDTYGLVVELDDPGFQALAQVARDSRAVAEEITAHARDMQIEVVARLRAAGLPLRDVGEIMGVSHQRIAQLLENAKDSEKRDDALEALERFFAGMLESIKGRDRVG